MSMAYTPGLKRKRYYTVSKVRRLPIEGELLVKKGERVSPNTVVARTMLPGKVQTFNVASKLGLEGDYDRATEEYTCKLTEHMIKKEGDTIDKDELIAKRVMFFGLIKRFYRSPVKGIIESISNVTGQIMIRAPSTPLNLEAYIPGIIIEVLPKEGVVIETSGAFIQGIFGICGESYGEIMMMVDSPDEILTAKQILPKCAGKVIVAGSLITGKALQKAQEIGVRGIIVGGIEDEDLRTFLGYDIGVAITGKEEVDLTLIVTEGFGKMAMAKKTFVLLQDSEGKLACINGATQIRSGVIRPEIIIPSKANSNEIKKTKEFMMEGMKPGLPIRIVRAPYFGVLGRIVALPPNLQRVETESMVRVLEVELDNGRIVTIPRANVELIEE